MAGAGPCSPLAIADVEPGTPARAWAAVHIQRGASHRQTDQVLEVGNALALSLPYYCHSLEGRAGKGVWWKVTWRSEEGVYAR